MTGQMSGIAVFSSALTAVQVSQLFSAGSAVSQTQYQTLVLATTGIKYFWKLVDTSGTSAVDSSGSGNTGTYTNSPTLNQTSPSFGSVGSPSTIMWPSRNILVSAAQILQSRVPLSGGGIAVATTATGTGGGGTSGSGQGGTGNGCYSGETRVCTPNADVPISALKPGDIIISKTGPQRVREVLRHDPQSRKMIQMSQGLVTPNHLIFDKTEWVPASEVFTNCSVVDYDGPVYNLLIDTDDYESKSFWLANGRLSHNGKTF